MNNANLYRLFERRFPNDAGAVFLDGIDGRQLRYSEIPSRSGQMLSLLQRHGVKKGDRVVVQVDKSFEYSTRSRMSVALTCRLKVRVR